MAFEDLETLDKITTGGGKSIFTADSVPGETHTGTVIDVQVRQVTNFQTGDPEFWPSGDPKQQAIIQLRTDEADDSEDDGVRAAYIKLWGKQKSALIDAARAAGGKKLSDVLRPGTIFTATYVGDEPPKTRGMSPTKLYQYQIQAPATSGQALDATLGTPAPAYVAPTAPAYQPPTPAAPVAQPVAQTPAAPAPTDTAATVRGLIQAGWTDEQIAESTKLPASAVAIMRNAA